MRVLTLLLATLLMVGCGGLDTATPSPVPTVPTTGDCAGIPIIPPGNPPDTLELTADPILEQKFPTTIDGQKLNDLASGGFVESLCVIGGQASVDAAKLNLPAGTDLSQISVASAQAVVDGLAAQITAFRWPGHTGAQLLAVVGILSSSVTGGPPRFTSDLEPLTLGGKSATRWINEADGSPSYLYASGDTLFIADSISPSQADKILAALP